ncbi:MAG: hypothetical protein SO168_01795, partial [Muribaculaceae bacterium]|nr:hypothetical protein [Muribaculaceae bacterium]
DFQIEVSVPNEGGYIDEFLIKIADSSLVDLIRDFVVAFITYYFTKKRIIDWVNGIRLCAQK